MTNYDQFLKTKALKVQSVGRSVSPADVHPMLFPFQRDTVVWAVGKGRAAIFLDTGLGKTFVQIEWARLMGERTLIVAPLSVASQTVREARKIGVNVLFVRSQADVDANNNQIFITNYEMIEHFDPAAFGAVVLDESSILKSLDGSTRRLVTEMFQETPYRLACTATPAPNDVTEIGRHSEFLGVMKDKEMLSAFFINDMEKSWRLKRHAVKPFYRWMASWAIALRKPSDLGYSDDGYVLPQLSIQPLYVNSNYVPEGQLFFTGLSGITDRVNVRRNTLENRVSAAAEMVNSSDEQWLVWCGLNEESSALAAAIPDAVIVEGAMDIEDKTERIEGFQDGKYRVLVTKPKIAGMGLNFQNCHNMAFVGLNDSWEQYYQGIRRCHRFGQTKPVNVQIVLSDIEEEIYQNVMNKEQESAGMMDSLVKAMREFTEQEIRGVDQKWEYKTDEATGNGWRLLLGDSCERMKEIAENSVDLSVFSPPFVSLYTYTPTERDMGNSKDEQQFFEQFAIVIDELLRITKPGRNACVHVQQVGATKVNDGFIGIKDFRGDVIRAFIGRGWVFHGEVTIDKNPQIQAIRKKVKGLMFVQLEKDSVANRPAFGDYILIFQKPGQNAVPVKPECTREEWITWAHPIWYDIKETDVLNVEAARSGDDERHICPLQKGLIERCIRLWTNKGELVFDPFNGIGSTGYEAVQRGRNYIGIELKEEYWKVASANLRNAERLVNPDLFAWAAQQGAANE